jgi:hypothetical protein
MERIGWEIQPAGWLLLVILGFLLIYFTIDWLKRSSNKTSENI